MQDKNSFICSNVSLLSAELKNYFEQNALKEKFNPIKIAEAISESQILESASEKDITDVVRFFSEKTDEKIRSNCLLELYKSVGISKISVLYFEKPFCSFVRSMYSFKPFKQILTPGKGLGSEPQKTEKALVEEWLSISEDERIDVIQGITSCLTSILNWSALEIICNPAKLNPASYIPYNEKKNFNGSIEIGPALLANPEKAILTIVHEIVHAVQRFTANSEFELLKTNLKNFYVDGFTYPFGSKQRLLAQIQPAETHAIFLQNVFEFMYIFPAHSPSQAFKNAYEKVFQGYTNFESSSIKFKKINTPHGDRIKAFALHETNSKELPA